MAARAPQSDYMAPPPSSHIRVWDLPTRLFHWALVVTVVGSVVTIELGGNWVEIHFWCGYAALTLLLFRLVWGFAGPRYARFGSFLYAPREIEAYARGLLGRGPGTRYLGHNPLGALSVFALLLSLAFQASTGLFANDDIASEGPLARFIGKDLSDRITGWHALNEKILYALVALHVAAILYYTLRKKEPLVRAMLTGDKEGRPQDAARDGAAVRIGALALVALAAAAVYVLVHLEK